MRYKLIVIFCICFGLLSSGLFSYQQVENAQRVLQHEVAAGDAQLAALGHTATGVRLLSYGMPPRQGPPLNGDGTPVLPTEQVGTLRDAGKPHPGAIVAADGAGVCPDGAGPFCTHMPIVSIEAYGAYPVRIQTPVASGAVESFTDSPFLDCTVKVMESEAGANHYTDTPRYQSRGVYKLRGNSSLMFDKPPYKLNLLDDLGMENHNIGFLGMDPHDKWVLNGPILDKTLLRNYIAMNAMGNIDPITPDVRFCELFINGLYQGVYVAMESVDVDEERVDLTKYKEGDPFTSYLLRGDRDINQPNKLDIFTDYAMMRRDINAVEVLYPPAAKLTPELQRYIEQDLSQIEKSLYSYDYRDPVYGARATMNVQSFIDYFIINELFLNLDAGHYSTYYYKDLRGKLAVGPVWDFNNALANDLDSLTKTENFFMPSAPLFDMLCMDPAFTQAVIARYRSLREDVLSTETLTRQMDDTIAWLGAAVSRNYAVWGYTFNPALTNASNTLQPASRTPADYPAAVQQMKSTLTERGNWLDAHIEVLRRYSHQAFTKKYQH